MKLVTFTVDGKKEEVGIWLEDGSVCPTEEIGYVFRDMNDLIMTVTKHDLVKMEKDAGALIGTEKCIPAGKYILLSPIPRPMQDVLCLGLNYTEHAEEAFSYNKVFAAEKAKPIFFSKRTTYSQGTGSPIPLHQDLTSKLDYENELGVILGKDALNVKEEEAEDYIFGYTVINDVSARDLQTEHKQWYFGKSLDGFTPMGPCITTADSIAYPPALRIYTTLNGELRQDSNTKMLIHGIGEILATLTQGMTLKAGTIIATGTPKGVIMGMENPQFLKKQDIVNCTIEGIGSLVNTVQ